MLVQLLAGVLLALGKPFNISLFALLRLRRGYWHRGSWPAVVPAARGPPPVQLCGGWWETHTRVWPEPACLSSGVSVCFSS